MRIKIFAKLNPLRRVVTISLLVLGVVSIVGTFKGFGAARTEEITSLIGANDSLLVVDPDGSTIISKNDTKKLIPASILKIFTSLTAIHYLGSEHRYRTEFFIDNNSNLKIKGFGDPLLISEIVREISRLLLLC